jgi:outer membrane protein assembly factor BamB
MDGHAGLGVRRYNQCDGSTVRLRLKDLLTNSTGGMNMRQVLSISTMRMLVLVLMLVLGWVQWAGAEDWPQWLGPNRDGISSEKIAPWKEPPAAIWKAEVGEGHSSPVVANGRVYLHVKEPARDAETLLAFDAASGKQLFARSYDRAPFNSIFGVGPRSTPVVSDGKVYTLGVTGVLSCWTADDGKLVWQRDTLKQFKVENLKFGVSTSPIVVGKAVIVNVGGKGASIVAFDRDDGSVLWQTLDDPASYSSPILVGKGQAQQLIFLTEDHLVGVRPSDGKVLWQSPFKDQLSESSTTPIVVDDILIASSVTVGSKALRLSLAPDGGAAKTLWQNDKLTCYFSTPVPVGPEHVYMVTGTFRPFPAVALNCVEVKTGKIVWTKANIGTFHAALLRTGDGSLLLHDDGGHLRLLAADVKEYRELAKSKVCGQTWAHPALADGRIYLRDSRELICLKLR